MCVYIFICMYICMCRCLAASSIVGYVAGVGDRHLKNVLFDGVCELVHIDFGVMFSQGRSLPVPETVPVRLTRDLVAGLGCMGVEGSFRRACEVTMESLRAVRGVIESIVQVVLFDPLTQWLPKRVEVATESPGTKKRTRKGLIASSTHTHTHTHTHRQINIHKRFNNNRLKHTQVLWRKLKRFCANILEL
eukprot:GHVR01037794.1.p1 GENE.GHVR01037794.1~~GHVR01037794.1.p1  ORF type:complete len:204 (+),score=64.20 GHVR01037794.1:41-613(+)